MTVGDMDVCQHDKLLHCGRLALRTANMDEKTTGLVEERKDLGEKRTDFR